MQFNFDLQRFFGGGGGTTVQEREPTEHELELQKLQVDQAKAYAPNIQHINNAATELLSLAYPDLRNIQSLYGGLHTQAQTRAGNALEGLGGIPSINSQAVQNTNNNLSGLSERYMDVANRMYNKNENLADFLTGKYKAVEDFMVDTYGKLGNATDSANQTLGGYINSNAAANSAANAGLQGVQNSNDTATDNYTNQLGRIAGSNENVTGAANRSLNNYIDRNTGAETLANSDIAGYLGQNANAANIANTKLKTTPTLPQVTQTSINIAGRTPMPPIISRGF